MTDSEIEWRGRFSNAEVQRVHHRAFDVAAPSEPDPWDAWTERHSLGWVTVRSDGVLIGFLNVVTDGGVHAWLQDVVVDPDHQLNGIGAAMVDLAAQRSKEADCEWLHVDFDDELAGFYLERCGFEPARAGLRHLR